MSAHGQHPLTIPPGKNPSDVQASLDRVGNTGTPGSGVNVSEPFANLHTTLTLVVDDDGNAVQLTANGTNKLTVEAVPTEGFSFVEWGGSLEGDTNPTELVPGAAAEIVAVFAEDEPG
jgi:hypothetical protein